jgi:hypothetical protein
MLAHYHSWFSQWFELNSRLVLSLCILWLLNLWICETALFSAALSRCSADVALRESALRPNAGVAHIHRIAIVADPQLTDEASYASVRRGTSLLRFVEYHSDVFMRKSFHELVRHVAPSAVVFAGDMFDGARYIPESAYTASERRFDWVFERPDGLTYRTLPFFNLSGNHDIGWGPWNRNAQPAYVERYSARFGGVNVVHRIGGFDWVFVSACTSTLPPSSDPELHAETLEFLDRVAERPHDVPRILMTHVPLYRPYGTTCGPLRVSKRPVTIGAGRDYISVLPQHVSEMILESVRPLAVFSGDDHDQCYVRHPVDASARSPFAGRVDELSTPEQTIGTFSWLQGNLWPSVAVVLLRADRVAPAVETVVCFLPAQMYIYFWYVACAVATLLACVLLARSATYKWRLLRLVFHWQDVRLAPMARILPVQLGSALLACGSVAKFVLSLYLFLFVFH